jgi:uncharacterized protein (TIGR01777 family)
MRVALAGSSGFIGSALTRSLREAGHETTLILRRNAGPGDILWNPDSQTIDARLLEGHDAVINFTGENIAGRWNDEKKRRIRDSRVKGSRLLVEAISGLEHKPSAYLAASAVGIYGDRGSETLTEASPPGRGFFGDLGVEWEAQLAPATDEGIRTVAMRFGIVLGRRGGALRKMLPPFLLGVAGPLGSGRQYMSWIALEDAVRAIFHLLMDSSLAGPVNVVSPNPVTNREFTRALAAELKRPAMIPVPAFIVRLMFGEMADEALLSSARVLPDKLQKSGFHFRYPEIRAALRHALRDG